MVESGGEHFAPKLAVEVRQWGNTLIRSAVEVRGEHSDAKLAVEV